MTLVYNIPWLCDGLQKTIYISCKILRLLCLQVLWWLFFSNQIKRISCGCTFPATSPWHETLWVATVPGGGISESPAHTGDPPSMLRPFTTFPEPALPAHSEPEDEREVRAWSLFWLVLSTCPVLSMLFLAFPWQVIVFQSPYSSPKYSFLTSLSGFENLCFLP